jgi:hypothetical protein
MHSGRPKKEREVRTHYYWVLSSWNPGHVNNDVTRIGQAGWITLSVVNIYTTALSPRPAPEIRIEEEETYQRYFLLSF